VFFELLLVNFNYLTSFPDLLLLSLSFPKEGGALLSMIKNQQGRMNSIPATLSDNLSSSGSVNDVGMEVTETTELMEGGELLEPELDVSDQSETTSKGGKSLAAFIAKLFSMVEDAKVCHLIHWNQNGGFIVVNPDEFAKEVLPQYFKHNNFASFVRQLNMYGFHKVNDFVQQSDQQHWEFSHPNFKKGKKEQLFDIKRKVSSKSGSRGKLEKDQQEVIEDLSEKVDKLEGELTKLQESYHSVTTELVSCKQLIREQRMAINQVIQFLGSGTSNEHSVEESTPKRRRAENGDDRTGNPGRLDDGVTFSSLSLPKEAQNNVSNNGNGNTSQI